MAIALASAVAWTGDDDFDEAVTSGAFSVSTDDIVVVAGTAGAVSSLTLSTTLSGMSWTSTEVLDGSGGRTYLWFGRSSSAQSSKTVTVTAAGGSFSYPSVAVQVFSGVKTSGTWYYANGQGTYATLGNLPNSPRTTAGSGETQVFVAYDYAYGALASSDATIITTTPGATGYRVLSSSGVSATTQLSSSAGSPSVAYVGYTLIPASSTTTHTADAASGVTATAAATATAAKSAGAAQTTTATTTATATKSTSGAAAQTTTATTTATAARTAVADAATTVTATVTATMDVSNPASAAADVSITATATATMALERFADAALTVTATTATTALREALAAAALTVTATRTAGATGGQIDPTPGTMRAVEIGAPTMRPVSTQVPRMVALTSVDAATMTLVFSSDATPATLGLPIFYGGDSSPAAAGLIAAGLPYLWITGGALYYEDGS